MVKVLIEKGADLKAFNLNAVNGLGNTALISAIEKGI